MHQAPYFLTTNVFNLKNRKSNEQVVLKGNDSLQVLNLLHRDSLEYYYSAMVSVCDAVRGLGQGFYTWPTVKLYYAVFYLLRAILATRSICVFYLGTTPYSVLVRPGERLCKGCGNTHGFVLSIFKKHFAGNVLLSQDIGYTSPLDWLTAMRENANYKESKFCEPNLPDLFKKIMGSGLYLAIDEYFKDKSYLYAFDPDHAMLAYPLAVLVHADIEISSTIPFKYSRADALFLRKLASKYRLNRFKKYELF